MNKKLIVLFFLILAILFGTAMLDSHDMLFTLEEFELNPVSQFFIDAGEAVLAGVILFFVGLLLFFVFTGVGVVVIGSLVLTGFVLVCVAFPFLLPLLIPVLALWAFIATMRKRRAVEKIS